MAEAVRKKGRHKEDSQREGCFQEGRHNYYIYKVGRRQGCPRNKVIYDEIGYDRDGGGLLYTQCVKLARPYRCCLFK